jgi:hypothetical protein
VDAERAHVVIPYAGAASAEVPRRAGWRTLKGGAELVIPPPARWRLLVGPAIGLLAVTALAGLGVAWCLFTATWVLERRPLPTRPDALLLLGASAGAAVAGLAAMTWAVAATGRSVRARHRASVIRVEAGTLSVESPAWRRTSVWQVVRVSSVRLERDHSMLPRFVPDARLEVDGDVVEVLRIPWAGAETPRAAEDRLREVLGLGRRNLSPARHLADVVADAGAKESEANGIG